MSLTVAVDANGGDHGMRVSIPASLAALRKHPSLGLILCGAESELRAALAREKAGNLESRIAILNAPQTVDSNEPPVQALRGKKNSSMRRAIDMVKEKRADACVSAGNTGALMAMARFVLKTLPGIARPAIFATLPRMGGRVHVLDLGANVESPPELLLQFAVMGAILVRYVEGKPAPTVGLLNIGVEDIKGNETIKKAAELMRASNLNYAGFVEGDAIYTGDVDLVVCDGLVGNVALKTSEGLAQMLNHILREEFRRNFMRKLSALCAMPVMRAVKQRTDHRRYNGATLLGLRGIVIKSHGSADALGFRHAIDQAVREVNNRVPQHIESELRSMLAARGAGGIGEGEGGRG